MGHDFNCPHCGRWVANCGFANHDHKKIFSFSTTCACGKKVSDSCGGGGSSGGGSGSGSGG